MDVHRQSKGILSVTLSNDIGLMWLTGIVIIIVTYESFNNSKIFYRTNERNELILYRDTDSMQQNDRTHSIDCILFWIMMRHLTHYDRYYPYLRQYMGRRHHRNQTHRIPRCTTNIDERQLCILLRLTSNFVLEKGLPWLVDCFVDEYLPCFVDLLD
jgi:hypothetical protein